MRLTALSFAVAGIVLAVGSTISDPPWQFGVALGFVLALLGGVAYLEGEGM